MLPNPCALYVANLLFLLLLLSSQHARVVAHQAEADCKAPMKPVTNGEAKKLKPHGTFIFTDEPSHFSSLLPAVFVTEKDFFNFKITPECTDGK